MKKLQILVTIAFIISIMSMNAFALPQTGPEPNGNMQNGNIQNGSNPNNSNPNNSSPNSSTPKSNTKSNEGKAEKGKCHKHHKDHKDPLQKLQEKKDDIGKDLKEGKITKEKADELTKRIDERIRQINEFNSLPLPEKKQQLSKIFKSNLEKKILEGKLTKEEGEKLLADFNKQLEKWDGKDFPHFTHKGKHKSNRQ